MKLSELIGEVIAAPEDQHDYEVEIEDSSGDYIPVKELRYEHGSKTVIIELGPYEA